MATQADTLNIKDLAVTVAKISSESFALDFVIRGDGAGGASWGRSFEIGVGLNADRDAATAVPITAYGLYDLDQDSFLRVESASGANEDSLVGELGGDAYVRIDSTVGVQIGRDATSAHGGGVALGISANAGNDRCVAIGVLASATGLESVAIGRESDSSGARCVAIGRLATCTAITNGAVAVGVGATSDGLGGTSLGRSSTAGFVSAAFGYESTATASSVGFGYQCNATNFSVAAGRASTATGLESQAVGYLSEVTGNRSAAYGARSIVSGARSVLVGVSNTISTGLTLDGVIALRTSDDATEFFSAQFDGLDGSNGSGDIGGRMGLGLPLNTMCTDSIDIGNSAGTIRIRNYFPTGSIPTTAAPGALLNDGAIGWAEGGVLVLNIGGTIYHFAGTAT